MLERKSVMKSWSLIIGALVCFFFGTVMFLITAKEMGINPLYALAYCIFLALGIQAYIYYQGKKGRR